MPIKKTNNKTSHKNCAIWQDEVFLLKMMIVFAILSFVGIIAFGCSYIGYLNVSKKLSKYSEQKSHLLLEKEQNKAMLDDIKSQIIVPVGDPQIAIIYDAEEMKKHQDFFRDAIDGDRLVVYEGLAVLYRPDNRKVVYYSNVVLDGPLNSASSTPTTTPNMTQ